MVKKNVKNIILVFDQADYYSQITTKSVYEIQRIKKKFSPSQNKNRFNNYRHPWVNKQGFQPVGRKIKRNIDK